MKIYNLKTDQYVFPKESHISGTDAVTILGKYITDLQFNTSRSRGTVRGKNEPRRFENCIFQYIDFYNLSEFSFINCKFINCFFIETCRSSFVNCESNIKEDFHSCLYETSDISVINSKNFDISLFTTFRKQNEEKQRQVEDIKKNLKYGYTVLRIPVLVKVQFDKDSKFKNLDKSCSAVANSVNVIDICPTADENVDLSKCKHIVENEINDIILDNACRRNNGYLEFYKDKNDINKYLL